MDEGEKGLALREEERCKRLQDLIDFLIPRPEKELSSRELSLLVTEMKSEMIGMKKERYLGIFIRKLER